MSSLSSPSGLATASSSRLPASARPSGSGRAAAGYGQSRARRTKPPLSDAQRKLVQHCQGFVRSIAWKIHRKLPRHLIDLDDLIGYGQLGLCDAAGEFDESLGVQFTTYAYRRVRGAILDGLSQMSWFRVADFHGGKYERVAEEVVSETESDGDGPIEHCESLRTTTTRLAMTYLFCQLAAGPADDAGEFADQISGTGPQPSEPLERREVASSLHGLIDDLSDRDRTFIRDIYFNERSIKQAGERHGLSKSWASRLHARLLSDLARDLAARGHGTAAGLGDPAASSTDDQSFAGPDTRSDCPSDPPPPRSTHEIAAAIESA